MASATLGSKAGTRQKSNANARVRSSRMNSALRARAASTPAAEDVPDMSKRVTMNWLVVGAWSAPVATMGWGYLSMFVPPKPAGGGKGTPAKDKIGNEIKASEWRRTHGPSDASLTQGLNSEPTYIMTDSESSILDYGLNAVCTHLGCVVPYDSNDKKFKCPCHGSQYDGTGKVIRGPAPLSLQLVNVEVNEDDNVIVSKYTDNTDWRTGEKPWWL